MSTTDTLRHVQGIAGGGAPRFSDKWNLKLVDEVRNLLLLVNLQREANKSMESVLQAERSAMAEKYRAQRMLMDSVHASLMEESGDLECIVSSETRRESTSSIASTALYGIEPVTVADESPSLTLEKALLQSTDHVSPEEPALCVLESDEVLGTRMKTKWLESLYLKHEARYQSLQGPCEMKEKAWRETEERRDFLTVQCKSLTEQASMLRNKQCGKLLSPHPMCYNSDASSSSLKYLKVVLCSYCSEGFPFNDVVVATCRHVYHPWCLVVHFGRDNLCADKLCKGRISPDWLKSFGIKEFDKEMYSQEVAEGCDEGRQGEILKWRSEALLHCPDYDESISILPTAEAVILHPEESEDAARTKGKFALFCHLPYFFAPYMYLILFHGSLEITYAASFNPE
jgi:hypothetical protein